MLPDLSQIFQAYERVRAEADAVFARMAADYPECVRCEAGCADCCHALFDLSLVEAMYINQAFARTFGYGPERSGILERAGQTDRALARLKRGMFRAEKEGEEPGAIVQRASTIRMACPLLGADQRCLMYADRPIICRLYGIPLDIAGKSHVCGFSAFAKGGEYPAVRLARIQARLGELSAAIARTVESRFEFDDVYVPLSMALLTRYDNAWLGIGEPRED